MASTEQPDYLVAPPRLAEGVHLVPYDEDWPRDFESARQRIQAALGDAVPVVEHVGSTAVPGLVAKPVIDVLLLLEDPADEEGYVPALRAAGFDLHLREPAWFQHRLLRGTDPAVNLHVFPIGCPEASRMLAFRDRLRTQPEDRDRYARAKLELAARPWDYVQDYADAKSDVVEAILGRATAPRHEQEGTS